MPKAKNVTMIPATLNLHTGTPKSANVKRRVAGYARVSTDSDEQFTSYEAQVDYYTKYILSKPDWEFAKVYTDEGISGTSTKRPTGTAVKARFQQSWSARIAAAFMALRYGTLPTSTATPSGSAIANSVVRNIATLQRLTRIRCRNCSSKPIIS